MTAKRFVAAQGVPGRHRGPEDGMGDETLVRRHVDGTTFWFHTGEGPPPRPSETQSTSASGRRTGTDS